MVLGHNFFPKFKKKKKKILNFPFFFKKKKRKKRYRMKVGRQKMVQF